MINHAMFSPNKHATNEFTDMLRALSEPTGKPVEVMTRCKLKVKVKYVPYNESHDIPHHFIMTTTGGFIMTTTGGDTLRWNADGSHTIYPHYDLCFYEDY